MMKTIRIVLLLLFIPACVRAQWSWSDLIYVDAGNTADFDIDPNTGYLHIVTMKPGPGVEYTVMDENGVLISREAVPNASSDTGGWKWGASIDVDTEGNPHVLYRREYPGDLYTTYYVHKDGEDWEERMLISDRILRGNTVRVALDGSDRVFILQGFGISVPYGAADFFRIVNGNKQRTAQNLSGHRTESCVELDAHRNGEVHILLGSPDPNHGPVSYYRSSDGGNTVQYIRDIHSSQCTGRNSHPDVFADKLNNVHICFGAQKDNARNGEPSIRYVLYKGNNMMRNTPATDYQDLKQWKNGEGWGLGSVAASDSGEYVVVAFLDKDPGELYATLSMDQGETWQTKVHLDGFFGGFEGRNIQKVRANRNNFYVIYPYEGGTALRMMKDVGDFAPNAKSGGPYQGNEGSIILINMSGSSDSGKNPGIVEYAWDWEGDGTFDLISVLPQVTVIFEDNMETQAVLRVTDKAGNTGYDTTGITIFNVPPAVQGVVTGTPQEGNSLLFSAQINEPGKQDTVSLLWVMNGDTVSDQTSFSRLFTDNAILTVIVRATDDDGGMGADTLNINVVNLPPVADIGGPYRVAVGESFLYEASATDPGIDDSLTYRWDMDGNGSFELSGKSVVHSFAELGHYTIVLEVSDDDGAKGYDSTQVVVGNAPPVLSSIPGQTISEGGTFQPVVLDNYVQDPDQPDESMTWTFSGQEDLLVGIANRILSVAVPDSEWSGTENIMLVVSDPLGEKDTTLVQYTVLPVNDPPAWLDVPSYEDNTLNEDDTLKIPLSYLRALVLDVDDDSLDLKFSISGNENIHAQNAPDGNTMFLFATPNWYGEEFINFVVRDKANASDLAAARITVRSVPDAPLPFDLIEPLDAQWEAWPDTVLFRWYGSVDPDVGESVYYIWEMLGYPSEGSIFRTQFLSDTLLTFIPDRNLVDGLYYWWVKARDPNGVETMSANSGIIIVGNVAVDETASGMIPEDFDLLQNYPNPFNPETWVVFHLPKTSEVRVTVYNALGQAVRVLAQGRHAPGVHRVQWDGRDGPGKKLPSGIYVCRMEAEGRVFNRKMVMVE